MTAFAKSWRRGGCGKATSVCGIGKCYNGCHALASRAASDPKLQHGLWTRLPRLALQMPMVGGQDNLRPRIHRWAQSLS
jgi:hypothetical protein